jgi:hypothetical protein
VLGCLLGWRPREIERAHSDPTVVMSDQNRDVLSPREVAERSRFSYHAIVRAIRRCDLQAFERCPVITGSKSSNTSGGCARLPEPARDGRKPHP